MKKFVGDVMDRSYEAITFISRRPRFANFADIIKIESMFIKTTFKDSKKVKRIRNYVLKCNVYIYIYIYYIYICFF